MKAASPLPWPRRRPGTCATVRMLAAWVEACGPPGSPCGGGGAARTRGRGEVGHAEAAPRTARFDGRRFVRDGRDEAVALQGQARCDGACAWMC